MKERHLNSFDIFNPQDYGDKKIVIVGAGGIGSTTAYGLAQMGFSNITVIDYDEVENHNISSQFYMEEDIGKVKVEALKKNIKLFTGVEINAINEKFKKEHTKDAYITIMGVDNMATRKEIAEAVEDGEMVIDCRMKGEAFMIEQFIPQEELDLYMKTWYSDEEADAGVCTNKSVSYNCLAIASIVARLVKGIATGEKYVLDKTSLQVDLKNLIIG